MTQRADVVVLTHLDPEIRAVRGALRQMYDYRDGSFACSAWLPAPGGRPVRVAAVQSADAFRSVIEDSRPAVAVLVGIAEEAHPGIQAGDVVVGTASFGRCLDDFFRAVPSEQLRSGEDSYRVHRGSPGDLPELAERDGWVVVRGIAGPAGGHRTHAGVAARHAAEVMAMLLPHLGSQP